MEGKKLFLYVNKLIFFILKINYNIDILTDFKIQFRNQIRKSSKKIIRKDGKLAKIRQKYQIF